jgi:hypothetical protein
MSAMQGNDGVNSPWVNVSLDQSHTHCGLRFTGGGNRAEPKTWSAGFVFSQMGFKRKWLLAFFT